MVITLRQIKAYLYIYCHEYKVCVTYRRVLDWMIAFIDTLYTALGTTGTVHRFTATYSKANVALA
jgi:hypothetical protein